MRSAAEGKGRVISAVQAVRSAHTKLLRDWQLS